MKKFKELFEEVLGEELKGKEKDYYNRGFRFVVVVKDSQGTLNEYFKDRKSAEEHSERLKKDKNDPTRVSAVYELKESKDPDKEEELQKKLLTDQEFKAWWEKMSYKNRKKEFEKKEKNEE